MVHTRYGRQAKLVQRVKKDRTVQTYAVVFCVVYWLDDMRGEPSGPERAALGSGKNLRLYGQASRAISTG